MVKVLAAFQAPSIPTSTANDFSFGNEHLAELAELLVPHAYKWRSIGIVLRFKPQDLDNIEASQSLIPGSPQSFLLRILEDWIRRKHEHALDPTVNHLEYVLNSRIVGLGVVAAELRTNVTLNQPFHVQNRALPYFVERLTILDTWHDNINWTSTKNIDSLVANENGSVLLEVLVDSEFERLNYQWYMNGVQISESIDHTGTTTSILCVSNAGIDMDGFKYSCCITFSDDDDSSDDSFDYRSTKIFETQMVTLRVNCPLDQYVSSLATVYLAQPEVPEDTWPPVSNTKHINLALIKQEQVNYGAEYARLTIRGDMDDVLQEKKTIEYDEVVQSLKSGCVLFIEGRPGSGKTTFVHKITRDWATTPNGAMRLVLLVSLRVLNDLNKPNLDLSDILNLFKDLKVTKELLEERNGKGVCFVFDGLDEFSPSNMEDSMVYKIITKEYLAKSSVIVASRPAAIAKLRRRANITIEVLGFPNVQILEYFDCYPFFNAKAEDLKTYLHAHPNILHMCYLPIHAAMVAFLFEVTGKVPKTETEIYAHFTRFTIMRSLTKKKTISANDIDIHKLSGEERVLFNQICKLALEKTIANKQVLHQDEVDSYFQSKKDGDISLGLITVDHTAGLYGFKNIYTFLHLTFQEYLAAYHISTLTDEGQHELIQLHGDKNHMLVVWKFFSGLIKFDTNDGKFIAIAQRVPKNSLFLVQSAYESQQLLVCTLLLKLSHASFEFEKQYLTIPDFTALGYVLANTSATSSPVSLSFNCCNINIEAVSAMLSECGEGNISIQTLQYHSERFDAVCDVEFLQEMFIATKSLKFFDLSSAIKCSCNMYTLLHSLPGLTSLCIRNTYINDLPAVLLHCKDLHKLALIDCIPSHQIPSFCDNIRYCKKMKVLDISNNNSFSKRYELLASALSAPCHNLEIETLIVSGNDNDSVGIKVLLNSLKGCKLKVSSNDILRGNKATISTLLEGLADCSNLHELRLAERMAKSDGTSFVSHSKNWKKLHTLELDGCIDDHRAADISQALSCNHITNLKILRVLGKLSCKLHYFGVTTLSSGLSKCTNLTEVLIRHCVFTDEGAEALADGLSHCKNICTLDLSYNEIRNNGAKAIFTSTRQMPRLEALNLSGNSIEHEGAVAMLNTLKCCTTLSNLNLNENQIGREGATAISICLPHWPNLRALCVCGKDTEENVGNKGAVTLAENLYCCAQLQILNLACNAIDDQAASSIVQNLAKCTSLTELYLEDNEISQGSHCLGVLQRWTHLDHLFY